MLCSKFRASFKKIMSFFDTYLLANADKALAISSKLKLWLSSDTAILITELTPNSWDDKLRILSLQYLTEAAIALQLVIDCKGKTFEEIVKILLDALKSYPPAAQEALLRKLSALMAGKFDMNRFKDNIYDLAIQSKYSVSVA